MNGNDPIPKPRQVYNITEYYAKIIPTYRASDHSL
jgi:hypothetical protein